MAYTFNEIIELAQRSGIPNNPGSTLRPGDRTKSGNISWHSSGNAVDFMGYNQDALAEFFMKFPTLEVIHKSQATGKTYGWNGSRNRPMDPVKNAQLFREHENHLHVAMSAEQVGPGSILDQLRKGIANLANVAAGAIQSGPLGGFIPKPANVTEALTNVGSAMQSGAQSLVSIGNLAQLVTKMFLPTNIIRGAAFLVGVSTLLVGIWFLGREVKESSP